MATAGPFARHGAALRKLFGEFASMRSRSSGGAERMGMEEFLRFAREHSLCPALLSRVDLLRLAAEAAAAQPAQRGGGTARWAADGAGGSAGADEAAPVAGDDDDGGCVEMTLDFGGFVRSLELSALLLFGGPEWAAQCPTLIRARCSCSSSGWTRAAGSSRATGTPSLGPPTRQGPPPTR